MRWINSCLLHCLFYLSLSLGVQSIYYGPTVLGDKNPTISGYKAAAKASSLSLQPNDPRKIVVIEDIHNIRTNL